MIHHYTENDHLLIVSDIHLKDDHDPLSARFIAWLSQHSQTASAIYILGDLFDYWVGHGCVQRYQRVFASLKQRSADCPIYFMAGNRDFLLHSQQLAQYGVHKIQDATVIHCANQRIVLTHGDRLCTADHSYQWLRHFLQNPITCFLARRLPYAFCLRIAQQLRRSSRQQTANKSSKLMQACDKATADLLQAHQATTLIHGHVHRLQHKALTASNSVYVLDSWEHCINYCQITPQGITLHQSK